jgi:predicted transcriptional regulator
MNEENKVDIIQAIDRVAERIAPGRSPSFAEAHVIKALEEIDQNDSVGRLRLSRDLHLGEGETRTLVKHLKKEGLIQISKSGISLSPNGRDLLHALRSLVSQSIEISSTPLALGPVNVAVRVTGMKESVKYGLEQRDAAILAGARGATTLIFRENELIIPGTREHASKSDPLILTSLSKMDLRDGDVIIIGSADEKIKAELGAKAAAVELLKSTTESTIRNRRP